MLIPYDVHSSLEQFRFRLLEDKHTNNFFQIHRHDYYEIVYITKGNVKFTIDFKIYNLEENTIYLIKPGQIHQWIEDDFNNKCKGYIFHFMKDFFLYDEMINNLFDNVSNPIIKVNNDSKNNINSLISMIKSEYGVYNKLTTHLFSSIIEYLLRLKQSKENLSFKDNRIYLLIGLIEQNFKEEKSALFYANHFELTTKRLNELAKIHIGKTVSSLIIDRNITEIKRSLIYSKSSIKGISEKLCFKDIAYFSSFFKHHTSFSPIEFRKFKIKQIDSP
ncbi:MAG: AraC family transcriptional regulator [Sulfurimonas sp.]|nr:AraC family transcriptional regulator [Sulfurimonas sp.]